MVSKKIHKRANQRNYIKRTIREYFRLHQAKWLPIDLIVRSQKHFTRLDLVHVIAELNQLSIKFSKNASANSHTPNS